MNIRVVQCFFAAVVSFLSPVGAHAADNWAATWTAAQQGAFAAPTAPAGLLAPGEFQGSVYFPQPDAIRFALPKGSGGRGTLMGTIVGAFILTLIGDVVFTSLWSSGTAYGTVEMRKGQLKLSVLGGSFELSNLGLPNGAGAVKAAALNKRALAFDNGEGALRFRAARLASGDVLEITAPALAVADLADVNAL